MADDSSTAASLLWADRYRPRELSDLSLHPQLTERLTELSKRPGMLPHLLFHGPPGAGKHVRVACLLRALFGPGADRVRVEHRQAKLGATETSSGHVVDLVTVSSAYHIELNPSDYGLRDRLVVQEVIKEIAQSRPLDTLTGAAAAKETTAKGHFKVVVINEVDSLSRDAQHALRRTMEKYVATCRVILVSNSACRVLAPIRSRCLAIRVGAPSEEECAAVLQGVAKREHFSLSDSVAQKLAEASGRNLRKALLALEATRMRSLLAGNSSSIPENAPIVRTDWEEYISAICHAILQEQTPASLLRVRERLYELLSHCIPATLILRTLALELVAKCDDAVRVPAIKAAAEYEHRLHLGTKDIFHLEAFVARFMALYRRFIQMQVADLALW